MLAKALGASEGDFIDWLTMRDQHMALIVGAQRIRFHPLVPHDIPIYRFMM
jgi:carbonic anhydrase